MVGLQGGLGGGTLGGFFNRILDWVPQVSYKKLVNGLQAATQDACVASNVCEESSVLSPEELLQDAKTLAQKYCTCPEED